MLNHGDDIMHRLVKVSGYENNYHLRHKNPPSGRGYKALVAKQPE
jgi:hypothetical protein